MHVQQNLWTQHASTHLILPDPDPDLFFGQNFQTNSKLLSSSVCYSFATKIIHSLVCFSHVNLNVNPCPKKPTTFPTLHESNTTSPTLQAPTLCFQHYMHHASHASWPWPIPVVCCKSCEQVKSFIFTGILYTCCHVTLWMLTPIQRNLPHVSNTTCITHLMHPDRDPS